MNSLKDILEGVEEWSTKIEEIGKLGLPLEDFYVHLQKEVTELVEGRNNDEMSDVMNCLAMLYVVGGYKVSFKDCYDKLLKREKKYEQERQTP